MVCPLKPKPSITPCLVTELLVRHFSPPIETYFTSNAEVEKNKKQKNKNRKTTFFVYQVKVRLEVQPWHTYIEHVLSEIGSSHLLLLPVAEQMIDLVVKVFSECRRVEINIFEGVWQSPPISSFPFPPPLTPSLILKCRHIRRASCCAGCSNDAVLVKPS